MRSTLVACAAANLRWNSAFQRNQSISSVTASRHRATGGVPQSLVLRVKGRYWPSLCDPYMPIHRNLRAEAPAFRRVWAWEEAAIAIWDFDLTAQAVIRLHRCRRLSDAEGQQEGRCIKFQKHVARLYDDRIFRFVADNMVSIWMLAGRMKIAFVCGERQRALLACRKGEVDLMLVGGKWYLAVVCGVPTPRRSALRRPPRGPWCQPCL
jgi:hypothetical protein